jgi:hypothetical protein
VATLANLVVKITADANQMTATLDKAEQRNRMFSDSVQRGMKVAGASMVALGGAVVGFAALSVKSFAETGDAVQKMAQRTGFSTEALSELSFAAEQSGASIETLEKGVKRMASFIEDGRQGLSTTTRALEAMGVSMEQLIGLSPEAAFDTLAGAIAGVEDPLRRSALAQDVFGRAGTELLPLLAEGAGGMAALRQQARDLGLVFDQDGADAAARFGDATNALGKSFDGLKFTVAESIVPMLSELAEKTAGLVSKFSKWADDNPALAKTLIAVGVALGAITLGLGAILLVLPGLIAAVTTFGVVTNIALAGIPLLIAAIVAGVALLILKWDEVVKFMKGAGGWILLAFGPIGLAAKLVIDNWELVKESIRKVFNFFVDAVNGIIDGLNGVIEAMNLVAGVFGQKVPEIEFRMSHLEQKVKGVENAYRNFAIGAGDSMEEVNRGHAALTGSLVEMEAGYTQTVAKHEEARARIRNEGVSSTVASINQVLEGLNLNGISGLAGTQLSNRLGEADLRGGISEDYQKESLESAPQRLADAIDPGTYKDSVLPALPGQFSGQASAYEQSDVARLAAQGITVNVYIDGREAQQSSADVHMEEDPYR